MNSKPIGAFFLCRRAWRKLALSAATAFFCVSIPFIAHPQGLRIQIGLTNGQNLRLQWNSTNGADYQLQRSVTNRLPLTAADWIPMLSLHATSAITVVTDSAPLSQRFYRVAQILGLSTNPPGLSVSPVRVDFQPGGFPSPAVISVSVSGTNTVTNVVFLENGVALGNGVLGLDNSWSFGLSWDGRTPQVHRITARVTGQNGATVDAPVSGFLLADPAKFVPVGSNGAPAYGQFVTADNSGNLAAFFFYPEGLADARTATGAHFTIPAGATLLQGAANQIQFTGGTFFRGEQDPSPMNASLGIHRLNIDSPTPTNVGTALGLPSGTPLQLLWGNTLIPWVDGALGSNGWAALKMLPSIGNFALPGTQDGLVVSFDPGARDPTLSYSFYGDWSPFNGGPQFRIPRAEPLTVYLSLSGRVSASGTVEATLSSGATVRGSVSWRDPNFEVRFEGKNILIPGFNSLVRALPVNPQQSSPKGTTTNELNAAAATLTGFRDSMRSLALGGLSQASTSGTQASSPLAQPTDSAGAALNGWAGRFVSWVSDRNGQVLDSQTLTDVQNVVANAAKAGEAANDLPTALKLLGDVLIIQTNRETALGLGASANAVRAQLDDAQARLIAAAQRIIDQTETFEPSADFTDTVNLLAAVGDTQNIASAPIAPTRSPAPLDAKSDVQNLANFVAQKLGPRFASRVQDAAQNVGLNGLSAGQLLDFVDDLVNYAKLLAYAGPNLPSGAPNRQQVLQAATNIRTHFASVANSSTADYQTVRDAVNERARFFALYDQLGLRMASDQDFGFLRSTSDLVNNFIEQFNSLPPSGQARACRVDIGSISSIAEHTSDNGARIDLPDAQSALQNCDELVLTALTQSSKSNSCADLKNALVGAQFKFAPRDPMAEGKAFPDITGLYESVDTGDEGYLTLQLNQGGRYLLGAMQLQVEDQKSRSVQYITWKVEGMFLRLTSVPGTTEFGCRTIRTSDGSVNFTLGTVTADASTGNIILKLGRIQFFQMARTGAFSDAIAGAFDRGQQGALKTSQKNPMHTRITQRTIADAKDLMLILDRYFSALLNSQDEVKAANDVSDKLTQMDQRLNPAQRPEAAGLIRRVLSTAPPRQVDRSKLTGNIADLGQRTVLYWDLLLAVAVRQGLNVKDQLAMTQEQFNNLAGQLGQDAFHYELVTTEKSFVGGDAFFAFGAGELNITVKKFSPNGQLADSFPLLGYFATYSPCWGPVPIPFACTLSSDTYTFDSPFNFVAQDFAGPIDLVRIGINDTVAPQLKEVIGFLNPITDVLDSIKSLANIDPNANTWGFGYIELHGSGRFPPLIFRTGPSFSVNDCLFNLGVGADIGAGFIIAGGGAPDPNQTILFETNQAVSFDVSAFADVQSGIFFEVNGTNITDCGWQFLREFIAQNHDLFVGTKSKIEVHGYADASGAGAFNTELAQNRAGSVRLALQGLLGKNLRSSIAAIGHGESEHDGVLASVFNNPSFLNPDFVPSDPAQRANLDDPLFRRADIIVGNVVKAKMFAPQTQKQ